MCNTDRLSCLWDSLFPSYQTIFDVPPLYHSQAHEVHTSCMYKWRRIGYSSQTITPVLVFNGHCVCVWGILFSSEFREYLVREKKILSNPEFWNRNFTWNSFKSFLLTFTESGLCFYSHFLHPAFYASQIYRWCPTCPINFRNSWWEMLHNHMNKTHYY